MKKINRSAASILAVLMATIQGCSTTGVQESAGEYALDAWITARVKTLLSEDAQIRATEINIETSKGVVLLTGFINSEWQWSRPYGMRKPSAESSRSRTTCV